MDITLLFLSALRCISHTAGQTEAIQCQCYTPFTTSPFYSFVPLASTIHGHYIIINNHFSTGDKLLIRPVLEAGVSNVKVYLPGRESHTIWYDVDSYQAYPANGYMNVDVNIAKVCFTFFFCYNVDYRTLWQTCFLQLHGLSRTYQDRQKEPSVKTLCSPISSEFLMHCLWSVIFASALLYKIYFVIRFQYTNAAVQQYHVKSESVALQL